MQVANINMTNSSHTCPQGLNATTHHPIRVCGIKATGQDCSSATFSVLGIEYSNVCGKVIGHQDGHPDGFGEGQTNTIDGTYVEGMSLTHGNSPRNHIWTFGAATNEVQDECPCFDGATVSVPSFVGNDYFCDTALHSDSLSVSGFHSGNPLWDGEGCGPTSTCCSFNNPPWFSKQLPSPTTDNIEMRLCVNSHSTEGINIEIVELYVQ